ncbi:Vinculin/alpha-catenin, partial [Trinorchestia longiramus]
MDAFKAAWENQVRILTDAVDDITTIDDFLAVSESHILEDVKTCVRAINEGDPDTLDRIAGAIRGRSSRVCHVVAAEMDNYEPCVYTDRVLEAVKVLRDQVLPNFAQRVDVAVEGLTNSAAGGGGNSRGKDVDENEFVDASHLVYDGVREIRMAVLMNKADDELDPDDVLMDEYHTLEMRSKSSAHTVDTTIDEYPGVSGITTARDAMRNLSEEDKEKIATQ